MHTKFAKLQVGKNVVSTKQQHSKDSPFPLAVAISGLAPLSKVWVDYLPQPKNIFVIKVNDEDIYSLIKEEVDYDPTKTETLKVTLKVNDKATISGPMPWIIGDIEEKIQTALGMNHLTSLEISGLNSISWVSNEFLDVLTCYDLPEHGIDKLIFNYFYPQCEPFQDEVISRLANMCPQITHL